MSCSGSHLEITINIKNTKFVKDLPMIDDTSQNKKMKLINESYEQAYTKSSNNNTCKIKTK
jgi:hypothetical protein